MKLLSLTASRYRSLRDVRISLGELNVFIGPNASGKSNILDALRLLQEGIEQRDFFEPVHSRAGILALAWMGEEACQVVLRVEVADCGHRYEWSVQLDREGNGFSVHETVFELHGESAPVQLLFSAKGAGWWLSGGTRQIPLAQAPTACALCAAAADATFPGRAIAEFVGGWGFFDPNQFLLRSRWSGLGTSRLDSYGRNLAERLNELKESSPQTFEEIVSATQAVLGVPIRIIPAPLGILQIEPGLRTAVPEFAASSGTLRILALMTALLGEPGSTVIGIEEPENHVHPAALAAFAEHLLRAKEHVQVLVTTHSPLLLDFLNEPSSVCVVHRSETEGTRAMREANPEGVRRALEESGFGLGEFYETTGFGA